MKKSYEFMVPGKPDALAPIRWVITRLAHLSGLDEEQISQIEIAVDEVCSNVMEHAYRSADPKPPILLKIRPQDDQFIIDVIDQGPPFDYQHRKIPHFPEHYIEGHERGAGLYIINKCMDEVSFERLPDDRNQMRLVKHKQAMN